MGRCFGLLPEKTKRPASGRAFVPLTILGPIYDTFTSMAFAFSDFGRWRFSTPSLNSAFTFSSSITSGSEKVRTKLPYDRSIR